MILVTGGAGYIGSHACVALAQAGHEILILDNLANSRREAVARLGTLCPVPPRFVEGDVRDAQLLRQVFASHPISAVLHFAGLKAVAESVQRPLDYYDNNVCGSVQLLRAMSAASVRTFVFSSSATVYGANAEVPYREDSETAAMNPYGHSKLMVEQLLGELMTSDDPWRIACLRYFNPVGAHPSGRIGEYPTGIPGNLMPYVAQVATGHRPFVNVWGNDYPTPDGTGIRDYIHVMDLALGHLAALDHLVDHAPGIITLNLGTGRGHSVLEMIDAFGRASGRVIPYRFAARRAGDIAQYWADSSRAQTLLGWRAERDIETMCADAWRWQQTIAQEIA